MSTRAPPTFFRLAASYQRGAQGLETPMHLTFDPVSAAWDTFKFWDKDESSTDNLTSDHPGPGERTGLRADAGEPSRRERAPGSRDSTESRHQLYWNHASKLRKEIDTHRADV